MESTGPLDRSSQKRLPRLEHYNIYENVVRILDRKLGRIADVDYRHGEMFCEVCESSECPHTGYAWSIYERYSSERRAV